MISADRFMFCSELKNVKLDDFLLEPRDVVLAHDAEEIFFLIGLRCPRQTAPSADFAWDGDKPSCPFGAFFLHHHGVGRRPECDDEFWRSLSHARCLCGLIELGSDDVRRCPQLVDDVVHVRNLTDSELIRDAEMV